MARSFNGSTDVITRTGVAGNPSSLTMSCWVNPTNLANAYGTTNWMRTTDGLTFAAIYVKSTGKLAMYYNNSGANYDGTGTFTLSTGTWYHLLFLGPSGVAVTGYVDGNLDGTGNQNFSNTTNFNGTTQAGADEGVGHPLNGVIADSAIWNIALSSGEISALAKGVRPYLIRPSSLVLWWPFDGIQSPEPDLSGNAYNGTLTGTALAAGPPTTLFTPKPPIFLPFTTTTAAQIYAFDQMAARFSRNITTIGY